MWLLNIVSVEGFREIVGYWDGSSKWECFVGLISCMEVILGSVSEFIFYLLWCVYIRWYVGILGLVLKLFKIILS